MNAAQIRGWLLIQPRASTIRVVTSDDRTHEVSCTSGASWAAIAASIEALEPVLIEAYDPKGAIIRAVRPHEENNARAEGTIAQPLVLPPGTDPQSVMLIHFADLLAQAYRHSTDVAFERLTSLFEAVNRRSEVLERSLDTTHRLLQKAAQAQLENAPEPEKGDPLEQMVASFMQGQQQAGETPQHAPHVNGVSNGKVG